MIHTGNFDEVRTAIFRAFAMGNSGTTEPPAVEDEDGEEEKTAAAGKA